MIILKICKTIIILILFFSFCFSESYSDELIRNSVVNFNRNIENKKRDKYRNPQETLLFFGIKPNMKVLEILPGKGYYTEILGNFLKDNGQLTVASFGENHKNKRLRSIHNTFKDYFSKNNKIFGEIDIKRFNGNGFLNEIPNNSFDMVLTFRNTHNWVKAGVINEVYGSINRVLKKDGILGVVQHRGKNSQDHIIASKSGYVPEKYLIELVEKMNFKFLSKSEINRNPLDTKDYKEGVWTLPPTLKLKNLNKSKYLEIGESDRMTIKFKKK